jgi:glycosyltransferase involved in cell wall biosynthesis
MKLSVMMITYNQEQYLRQALDSVLMQKVNFEYEVVIGEDNSTDSTRQILLEYAQKHPDKIRLILRDQNIGVIRNFFSTLEACKGQYIALLEGDDYWTCDRKLQTQVDYLDARPDYVICSHNAVVHYQDGRKPDFRFVRPDQPETTELAQLLVDNVIPTCSAVYRRTAMILPPPDWVYDLKMADYPLHVLTAQHGKIGYINEVMGVYRLHGGGVYSQTETVNRIQNSVKCFRAFLTGLEPRFRRAVKLNLARKLWALGFEYEARGQRMLAMRTLLSSMTTCPSTGNPSLRSKFSVLARVAAPKTHHRLSKAYGSVFGIKVTAPEHPASHDRTTGTKEPRVSVIIPAYNAQKYIVEAVESMLVQTFTDFECIVVDDGSTDRTGQLLSMLAERDSRVRPMQVRHGGIVEALNAGIDSARGELIARMDADDVALPARLEEQVRYMDAHPDVVALGSKVLLVDPYNSPLWEIEVKTEHRDIDAELMVGNGWALFHPTSIIRKKALVQVGKYRPEYQWSEDIDLFLRLAEVGKLANLPTATLRYRQHYASVNRTKLDLQVKRVERLIADAYRRRGMQLPGDFHYTPVAHLQPHEQFCAWGRRALLNRNFKAARRHAFATVRHAPTQYDSWSLLFHSLIRR